MQRTVRQALARSMLYSSHPSSDRNFNAKRLRGGSPGPFRLFGPPVRPRPRVAGPSAAVPPVLRTDPRGRDPSGRIARPAFGGPAPGRRRAAAGRPVQFFLRPGPAIVRSVPCGQSSSRCNLLISRLKKYEAQGLGALARCMLKKSEHLPLKGILHQDGLGVAPRGRLALWRQADHAQGIGSPPVPAGRWPPARGRASPGALRARPGAASGPRRPGSEGGGPVRFSAWWSRWRWW